MAPTVLGLIHLRPLFNSTGMSLERRRREETSINVLKAIFGLFCSLLLMILGVHTAKAASRTIGIMTASVAVVQKCTLSSSGGLILDRGTEKTNSPQSLQVILMCARGDSGISIDINFANTSTFEPFMKNESGKTIPYRVYLDPGLTIPYTASPYTTVSLESQIPMPINIYVQILSNTSTPISEGTYTDRMRLTVTF